MNSRSPKGIALITALLITIVLEAIGAGLVMLGYLDASPLVLVLSFPVVLAAIYFAFLTAIQRFLYHKIRLIYKTIYTQKRAATPAQQLDLSTDVLGQVNREVAAWADQKSKEIQQLKAQEAYRRDFIGNVSHELKTPLFNIQGYVLTLLEGGLEDKNINRKYIARAEKSVNRLIEIVEDLDEITKFEAGQLKLNMQRTNLIDLAQEVVDSFELKAKESNISFFGLKKSYDPIYVSCDRERIGQVLTNLISNAIKYGKESGGSIEIRFYDMDENILTEVADNGPGIEEIHLPRLFERFYRVEESRSRDKGGSGLGLAIVKHIVEAHNQTINVRSTKGVGATFSFTLKKVH